jgi:hypothetical protein
MNHPLNIQVGYHQSSKMPAKATDRWGTFLRWDWWLKVPLARLPHSEAPPFQAPERSAGGLVVNEAK